jgi:class 3 adenylate cyclase
MSWSRTLKIRQQLRAQIESGEEIALLFSDLRGFSTYAMREGDRAAFHLTQQHESILHERISNYGIVVKSLGDGVMAAFETAAAAIEAAVSIQQFLRGHNAQNPSDPIHVGIGVSSGTPIMTDIDFIGHTVNLAQRLSGVAKGGQILTTDHVRQATPLAPGLRYVPLGQRMLKGIGTEALVEVGWLREVARVSDRRDRVTLILTERGTIVIALARDARQVVRNALEEFIADRPNDIGLLHALLQQAAARWLLRTLRRASVPFDGPRELDVATVRLSHRRDGLALRVPAGELWLRGGDPSSARGFIKAVSRMQATGEGRTGDQEARG